MAPGERVVCFIVGRCRLRTCWCRKEQNNWTKKRCAAKSAYVTALLQSIQLSRRELILPAVAANVEILRCSLPSLPWHRLPFHLQLLCAWRCAGQMISIWKCVRCSAVCASTRLLFMQAHTGLGRSRSVNAPCALQRHVTDRREQVAKLLWPSHCDLKPSDVKMSLQA